MLFKLFLLFFFMLCFATTLSLLGQINAHCEKIIS